MVVVVVVVVIVIVVVVTLTVTFGILSKRSILQTSQILETVIIKVIYAE